MVIYLSRLCESFAHILRLFCLFCSTDVNVFDGFIFQNRFKGSIAEREHMKWKNAVDLPNNPYSVEALQRRLSQSSTQKSFVVESLGLLSPTKEKINQTDSVENENQIDFK